MKVLIVGLGSIAKKHICAIRNQFSSCEIFALRSGRNHEEREGVINVYKIGEVPKDIDFSIISNPTSKHYKTIEELVGLGKPIMVEKPVLDSLNNVEPLQELLRRKSIITYVACNLRFHPVISRLKQEIERRKPIEMNVYCGSYLPDWRPQQDYRQVYSAKASMGGGVHLDLIHELDYSIYLMGMPDHVQSYRSRKSKLEIDSKDIAHYVLEYPQSSMFITTNYYRRKAKREIECVWEDDTWVADLISSTIRDDLGRVVFSCGEFDIMDTYKDQLIYFYKSILEKNAPMNSFEEAVDILKICLN